MTFTVLLLFHPFIYGQSLLCEGSDVIALMSKEQTASAGDRTSTLRTNFSKGVGSRQVSVLKVHLFLVVFQRRQMPKEKGKWMDRKLIYKIKKIRTRSGLLKTKICLDYSIFLKWRNFYCFWANKDGWVDAISVTCLSPIFVLFLLLRIKRNSRSKQYGNSGFWFVGQIQVNSMVRKLSRPERIAVLSIYTTTLIFANLFRLNISGKLTPVINT